MTPLLGILALGLGVSLVLTPLVRGLARHAGLLDQPDGRRKIHDRPVPVAGGLAVFLATCLAVAAPVALGTGLGDQLLEHQRDLVALSLAAAVICLVGVLDDRGMLRGRHKLLGQCGAVLVLLVFGVGVRQVHLFGYSVELGPLSLPFTVFLLLGAINSLNLIDGMDGLLSSVAIIISLSLAGMAAICGHWWAAVVAVALAGSLLGFLRYNFPPASIFLGDSGSMLVGLVLGYLAIHCSLKGPATIALAAPVASLTIPILDTTAAILRRKLTGRSIYTTDRGHLHHCLLRRGLSTHYVLLFVAVLCALTSLGGLASLAFNNELFALITAVTVVGILLVFRLFGHAEAVLVKERLVALGSSFFQAGGTGRSHELEVRLQGDADWNELWRTLTARAESLNLSQIRLDVNAPALHEGYHARWDRLAREREAPPTWRAEVPLTSQGVSLGKLEIAGLADEEPVWLKLAAVGQVILDFEQSRTARAAAAPEALRESDETALLETPRIHRNGPPPVVRLNTALDR